MSTLLHVSASSRGASSDSRALAGAFLDSHRRANPDVVVEELDLFDGKLPSFGRLAAEAKPASGVKLNSQPGWLMMSIHCLRAYGTPAFHMGTVKR